jgi:hypothetical protein
MKGPPNFYLRMFVTEISGRHMEVISVSCTGFVCIWFYLKFLHVVHKTKTKNKLHGFSPQSELYWPSDCCMSVKLVPSLSG